MNNAASDMGFDVPTAPPQETGIRATALDIALEAPRLKPEGLSQPLPSFRLPDPVLRKEETPIELTDTDEPMPADFASALAELTFIQGYSEIDPRKERARMRRRVLLGEHVIRLQNGDPAPSSITADEQARQRRLNPFDHSTQRLAFLASKHPEVASLRDSHVSE